MTWNQMHSGCAVDLLEPRPEQFELDDIAWHLAGIRRWHGIGISVAEHSVYVSQLVPERFARAALLHDAAEAIVGDASQPLKVAMRELCKEADFKESPFDAIENRIAVAICKRFGVLVEDMRSEEVRAADLRCMVAEKRALWGDTEARPWGLPAVEDWKLPGPVCDKVRNTWCTPWPVEGARVMFLERAEALWIK